MRSFALLPLFISAAVAQATFDITQLPACALTCMIGLANDGCTSPTDLACQCKNPALQNTALPCLQSSCPSADQQQIIAGVQAACAQAGVPLPAASTPTAAATTPAAATPAGSSVVVASPAPSSWPAGNGTNPAVGTGTVTVPCTTSSSVVPYTGGATPNNVAGGILGAVVVVAAALGL